MIDFILRFSSWNEFLANHILEHMDPSELIRDDKKLLKLLQIMMRIKDVKPDIERILSEKHYADKWRAHVTLDEIRESAGVDSNIFVNIDKSARNIAHVLVPEAGAVEMAVAAPAAPTDLVLPRYIYPRTYRPSGTSLLARVRAELPDATELAIESIAVWLSQVYPWRMNGADIQWMNSMLSSIESNPVNSREAAVREYIQRCYRGLHSGPIVEMREFDCTSCFETKTLAVVPPCCNMHDDTEAICFACTIENINVNAATKTAECEICHKCLAPTSVRELLDLTLEPSR